MFDEEEDRLTEIGFLELDDTTNEDNALWEVKTPLPTNTADLNLQRQRELKIMSFIGSCFAELLQNEINGRNSVDTSKSSKNTILTFTTLLQPTLSSYRVHMEADNRKHTRAMRQMLHNNFQRSLLLQEVRLQRMPELLLPED